MRGAAFGVRVRPLRGGHLAEKRGALPGRERPNSGHCARPVARSPQHTLWVQGPQRWPIQINSLGCCDHSVAARRSAAPRCTRRSRRTRSYRRCSLLRACARKARKAQRPSRPRHPLRADESTGRSDSYRLLPNGPCTHSSDRTRARSSVSTCLGVLLSLSTSLAGELPSASPSRKSWRTAKRHRDAPASKYSFMQPSR